jgi:SAM-dependent methyltransferase
MVDRLFSDPDLARWYDQLSAGREDFRFYLPLVMSAHSVLDLGCGTGDLLHRARVTGHAGRLCGLDPAGAMLDLARRRSDIEWVHGDAASAGFGGEFDLVVMTGHAFQVFITDDELRAVLAAVRSALTDDGRFAFETRNPAARAWQEWTADRVWEVTDASGAVLRYWRQVQTPVNGDLVRFAAMFAGPGNGEPTVSWSTLRFLDADTLSSFLTDAGFVIADQYGDFARHPLTDTSPEIVTICTPDVS